MKVTIISDSYSLLFRQETLSGTIGNEPIYYEVEAFTWNYGDCDVWISSPQDEICFTNSNKRPTTVEPCDCSVAPSDCTGTNRSFPNLGEKFYIIMNRQSTNSSSTQYSLTVNVEEYTNSIDELVFWVHFGIFLGIGAVMVLICCSCIPCVVSGGVIQFRARKARQLQQLQAI